MIKFLHAADLHLDAPFSSLGREQAVLRRREQREAVRRLVEICNAEGCHLLLLAGDLESRDALELVTNCFRFIRDYRGEVPGASAKDCGNYLDMNLGMANLWGGRYTALLENIPEDRLTYPV